MFLTIGYPLNSHDNLYVVFDTDDEIEVILDGSTDGTPFQLDSHLYNGFNGFKM